VNLFGVSEPNVQVSSFEGKDRVIVELPGVKDTKKAIELVGKTAQLGFAEAGTEESLVLTNKSNRADLKGGCGF
jgi:preprotein translocase subunit SecD